jgi:hypothetical protein
MRCMVSQMHCRESLRQLQRLAADRRGAVAITFAIVLPVVVGAVGLGVETGLWYNSKRQVQTAADAAALAGAIERQRGMGPAVLAAAREGAARNGFEDDGETVVVELYSPPITGPNLGRTTAIEARVFRRHAALFSAVLGGEAVTVSGRAVANAAFNGRACVLALDPAASGAITSQGLPLITMAGCIIAANSAHDTAIVVGGNSTLSAESLWIVGDYSLGSGTNLDLARPPVTRTYAINDPYAGIEMPSIGGCDATNLRINPSQTRTLSPGVYCGGMQINGDATLQPGVYIMDRGDFEVRAHARVRCACTSPEEGVTIILTSSGDASAIGKVQINGGADIVLRAPSDPTADYRGLAFIQDRRAPAGAVSKLNGGASQSFRGALYFPAQRIEWSGSSDTTLPGCVQLVARMVTFLGNSAIDNEACNEGGVNTIPIIEIRLVE